MSAGTQVRERVLLDVRGVTKSYRRGPEVVHALQGVTFTLAPGEVVGLVGPSGSGKTTLLNVLCGWEHPEGGEMLWLGEERTSSPATRPWADLAIVPQDLGLIEELSVRENVELPIRLGPPGLREERRARAGSLIDGFGLGALAGRNPGEISLGEQQRSALARALVLRPRLLLADEPTAHQDAAWVRGVLKAFRMASEEGSSCLIATHNREALRYVDRIISIRDGVVEPMDRPSAVPEGHEDDDESIWRPPES